MNDKGQLILQTSSMCYWSSGENLVPEYCPTEEEDKSQEQEQWGQRSTLELEPGFHPFLEVLSAPVP